MLLKVIYEKFSGWVGVVRGFLALASILTVHYWFFIVSLPGNVSFLVDNEYFLQFSFLFAGHLALAIFFVYLYDASLAALFSVFEDVVGEGKITRFIDALKSSVAKAILGAIIFSAIYCSFLPFKWLIDYIVDLENLIIVAGTMISMALILFSDKFRRWRLAKSGGSEKNPTSPNDFNRNLNGLVASSLAIVLGFSAILGAARAEAISDDPAQILMLDEGEMRMKIVGSSNSLIFGIEEECKCVVAVSTASILYISEER